MNKRALTSEDFAAALHHPLHRLMDGPARATSGPDDIPDEEMPLDALFTRIIRQGLSSLAGVMAQGKVIIVGAGPAGLCAGYELTRAGMEVTLLESSQRVGGRIKTISEPFAQGLHAEGGAMRLPRNHVLVRTYLKEFGLDDQLEPFEQANNLIYLSTYGKTITYAEFNRLLRDRDPGLLQCFPDLKENERGKTIDALWEAAVQPVVRDFNAVFKGDPNNIASAYQAITDKYDRYSLQTYFEQVAGWSQDCISLFDLGSPHVVLDNAFIESWKDAFLSSQAGGQQAGMQQLKRGMDQIPLAFLAPGLPASLKDAIRYGAKVASVLHLPDGPAGRRVEVVYRTRSGAVMSALADYVLFTIPFTAQRMVQVDPPFSVRKMNAIRELRYVEVTKILLQFKTRWWETYLKDRGQKPEGGLVTDLPIRYAMFPVSTSAQFADGQHRGVVMASYTFQQDATESGALSQDAVVRLAADNMATIFGRDLIDANLEVGTSQAWSADSFSGGSAFTYFAPMQKTRLFATMTQPEWNDAAHFAGEHVSYSHGWIEGAFESALRAAYQIYMSAIGIRTDGRPRGKGGDA